MNLEKFAKKLIKGMKTTRDNAEKDRRATAAYWNGDDWGSISGVLDAAEWVDNQVVNYTVKELKNYETLRNTKMENQAIENFENEGGSL